MRRLGDCVLLFDDEGADDSFVCDEKKGFRVWDCLVYIHYSNFLDLIRGHESWSRIPLEYESHRGRRILIHPQPSSILNGKSQ